MSTNFTFLKTTDRNLYDIISDAEKLYRDEYFEQCIGQTRRFAEGICKKTLGDNYVGLNTFDEMLATLKDKSHGFEQEKEFIDDLYFLKQQGNLTVHSTRVNQDAIVALECLKRAFEIAISYSVYYKNQKSNILKLQYDVELLITGKKNKSLAQRYSEKKIKTIKEEKKERKVQIKKPTKITAKTKPQKTSATKISAKQTRLKNTTTKVIKKTSTKKRTRKRKQNKKHFITFITTLLALSLLVIFFLTCFSKIYELTDFIR